jgi:hypothetical protein
MNYRPNVILFEKDWAYFPLAIRDTQTKNRSFVELAEKYRRMGIRNCDFMLALYHPELQGVDPHSAVLSVETMTKIGLECKHNPWYFFREVMLVPPQASATPLPFRANRGNIALYWLFFNHVDMALIQPRQTGKSLSVDGLMTYLMFIGSQNTRINLLTKDNPLREANVERLKEIRNYLPRYVYQQARGDSDNKHDMTNESKNNLYSTAVAQNSESSARKSGRGLTAPIFHSDEGPFTNYIHVTLPSSLAAGVAARDEARASGAYYGSIFTTTAGKKDEAAGKYMYGLIHSGLPWSEHLYDCEDSGELTNLVERNAAVQKTAKPMVNITMSHRQLGYTDEWLWKTMAECASFGEEADRDFFNVWTSGGVSSPLTTELNGVIRASQKEVQHMEISKRGYILKWYISEREIASRLAYGTYVLGMDTSDAIGRDYISMVIMDTSNLEVVAAAAINTTNILHFVDYICDIMIKYTTITLVPERKSTGQTLVDALLIRLPAAGIDPFKRIYNVIIDNDRTREEAFKLVTQDVSRRPSWFYDKVKKYFGFVTGGSGDHSREALYGKALQRAARMGGTKVNDKSLIDEITSLVVKDGRIDHTADSHDDMTVAWLLCVWFLTMGRSLGHYGITNALAECEEVGVVRDTAPKDAYDTYQAQVIESSKFEMEELLNQLNACKDDNLAMKLEARIRKLDTRLPDEFSEANTVDGLINEALEQRGRLIREATQRRPRYTPGKNNISYY